MIFLKRFFEYSIFISALLLAFLLAFESYLQVPHLVSWLGHWHPLILHFPIVLIFVTIIQYWRKDEYVEWYLSVTTLATLLTAITGFLLSVESGSKGNTIIIHQWLGAGVAYLTALWYWISSGKLKSRKIYLPLPIRFNYSDCDHWSLWWDGYSWRRFPVVEKE
jgi:phosphoglycerol transferase MdoB-like AlkP superfamily enzyme